MPLNPKIGPASRALFYEETAYETDPGSPVAYVIKLNQATGFKPRRRGIPVPIWQGNRQPFSKVPGPLEADGQIVSDLEYRTAPRLMKIQMGGSVAPVAIGGGQLHYIPLNTALTPGSCQIQYEWPGGGSTLYERSKGVRLGTWRFGFDPDGVVTFTTDFMGTGLRVATDLAGTKNEESFAGQTYYNSTVKLDTLILGGVSKYEFSMGNALKRVAVSSRGGLAGAITPGIFTCEGRLGIVLEDFTFYNQAIAQTLLRLEKLWGNNTMSLLDQFLFLVAPQTRFFAEGSNVGGEDEHSIESDFNVEYADTTATGANALEAFTFSGKGPYNIPSPSNLGVKVNGAATVVKALTPGATQSAANIVTDLLAGGGIANAISEGWPKDALGDFNRFKIASLLKGTGASIQIDTGTANTAHAVLGLNGTVFTGKAPTAIHSFWFNDIAVAL